MTTLIEMSEKILKAIKVSVLFSVNKALLVFLIFMAIKAIQVNTKQESYK